MKAFACLVFFILPVAAFCGEIQGKVLNAQGAAVAGASVSVSSDQTLPSDKTVTGPDGSFAITGLAPGVYTVTVSVANGQQILRREVSVGAEPAAIRAEFRLPAVAVQQLSGAEERNPNIFIYRIDLNDVRNRIGTARGPDPTYLPELRPSQNYFGAEFGAPLLAFEGIRPRSLISSWHGALSGTHQNSVLNARNFFNVGPLRPSRSTSFGTTAEGPLIRNKVSLLLDFGQAFTSGFVNGNVQAPLANQRTPAAASPQVNTIIGQLLKAFPVDLPNLPYVSLHQLNSNSNRDVKNTDGLARLDLKLSDRDSAALRYIVNEYVEDPFQIILGQNPHTELRSQGLYTNLTHTFSPQAQVRLGFHFDRARADLEVTKQYSDLFKPLGLPTVPDVAFRSGSLGLSATLGLGPGKQFPRVRAQNRFQFYADLSKQSGRHSLTAGWGIARVQVNDLQSDSKRGTIFFASDFGTDEITNFLLGRASALTLALGDLYRGFRNWEHYFYFGDQIRIAPTFSVSVGARYELMTAPTEVNHRTDVGFPTDKNNVAPRFGFAWNPRKGKTTVRGAYGISYGTIFPVTYGESRFNPPGVGVLQITSPDLTNLVNLLETSSQKPAPGARSATFRLSPDLAFPYSHQYSFAIERQLPGAAQLTMAYFGMRAFHLLTLGIYNRPDRDPRPQCSETILIRTCNTTSDINARRPDQHFFDENLIESNGIGYYDAVQVNLSKRLSRGLTVRAAYTFSKGIDLGGDFTSTASGLDVPPEVGTSTCERCDRVSDEKGLSAFDTPHALLFVYSYNLPSPSKAKGWAPAVFKRWQVSGTTIFQSGLPYHVHTGSDAPGFGNVDGSTTDRANILKPSLIGKSFDNPDTAPVLLGADTCQQPTAATPYLHCKYFDDNIPVAGRGNLGMNTFRKDGTWNTNFALSRTFPFFGGAERSLQFRAEFYNLFNHPQFDKPGYQLAADMFGKITNTVNKGRQVQFSLRLNF